MRQLKSMCPRVQVYISLASFSCSQAEDGSCGCKDGSLLGSVGGNLCIYQPEPGLKIPTSSPSRFSRAPFSGCEYVTARYCPPGFSGGDLGASCVAIAGRPGHSMATSVSNTWRCLSVEEGCAPDWYGRCQSHYDSSACTAALMQLICDLCCRVLRPEQHMRRRRIPRAARLPVQGIQSRGRKPGHSGQMCGQCL